MALLAAYSFDEASGDVLDRSGNGRDWALTNGTARTAGGHTNNGLTKSGGAGSMGLIADPSFLPADAWTIMFWQRNPGDAPWWLRLFNNAAGTGHGLLNVAGTLRVRIRTAAGSNVEASTTPPAQDDVDHHYAATYDGTNGRLYVDGVLIGTTASAPSPASIDRIDIAEHTVANFVMDDVRLYDEALDQATIADLMNTPVTDAPTDVTGTASGSGGGVGAATGTRERVATATGAGGGLGAATGIRELVGVASGGGAGGGAAVGVREVVGVAVGAGGGVGVMVSADAALTPAERTFVVPAESRVSVVPAESRVAEVT